MSDHLYGPNLSMLLRLLAGKLWFFLTLNTWDRLSNVNIYTCPTLRARPHYTLACPLNRSLHEIHTVLRYEVGLVYLNATLPGSELFSGPALGISSFVGTIRPQSWYLVAKRFVSATKGRDSVSHDLGLLRESAHGQRQCTLQKIDG